MPVGGVQGRQDVEFQGHDSVQLLLVQTGTVCSVLVPPTEPEAGRIDAIDAHRTGRQPLKT